MYNVEKKNNNNNFLSLFDDFNDFFNDTLAKDMKTNIVENETNYVITSEVPGVKKENVKIDVLDGMLTISISKKQENKENEKKNYIVKEISESSYSRSFYLDNMDEENIQAKMDNGVLTITVEKMKEVKPQTKKITIE